MFELEVSLTESQCYATMILAKNYTFETVISLNSLCIQTYPKWIMIIANKT
jgi:hypothetical protein